jgi:hypothetical protein
MIKIRTGLKAGKLVGDTLERLGKATGLDKCAEKYTQQTGKDCGCAKRKTILDKLFPF